MFHRFMAVPSVHEEVFAGEIGIAGEIHAEFPQTGFVSRRGDVRDMRFTSTEESEPLHGGLGRGVHRCAYAECDERFFQVQAYDPASQGVLLEAAQGLGDIGRKKMDPVGDAGEDFHCIEYEA